MDIRPSTRPDTVAPVGNIQEALPFLFSLILVGMAGNFFRFPLFFDIDFLFGSIFALLALQFYGLRRGVIAAALISASTIILWNHPYAWLILTAEVAVVGWLYPRRKIGLVLADTLFWLCLGMPLTYLFYHGVMDVSWEGASIDMIKQAVNGIANALIARLLFAGYTLLSRRRFLPLREIISALLGFFVLFPALIFLAISSRDDFASNDQRIRAALLHERDEMSDRLKEWLNDRQAPIGTLKFDDIEKILGVNIARDGLHLTLLDRQGKVIATNDDEQKPMTALVRGQGIIIPLAKGIAQWIPTLPATTPTSERWKNSYYFSEEQHIGEFSEWTLILEQPIAPLRKQLYNSYTRKLTLLFLILLGSLLLAELLSRWITRSSEELLAITSDLPTRLSGDHPIVWPESAIFETRRLIENFRSMTAALSEQFFAIRKLNLSLEERVEIRTQELSESRERYDLALLGSKDGIWDWNVLTGEVFFSVHCFEMLGYVANELEPSIAAFENLLHPDDLECVRQQIRQHVEERIPYSVEFRLRRKDGEYSWILARGQALWNEQGEAVRMAGSHTDISERKKSEQLILTSLREKEVLLKEIHHRVKNNLQIVYSLLALQASNITDSDIRILFDESRNRIGSMALIHEKIYSSEDLSHIDFSHYLQELTQNIAATYLRAEIKVVVMAEPLFLDINSGIPCGLIVNELVSNSFKYAFPAGREGQIMIKMNRSDEHRYLLTVEDNGIGFPEEIDFRHTTSLGLQLVTVLAGQLQGEISLNTDAGTRFTISFPGQPHNEDKI